jgi:uncharacterized protein YgiM (DUF1202 family)
MTISNHHNILSTLLILLLLPALVSCNFTGGAPVDKNANATATAIFQTLEAQSAEMTAQAGSPPAAPAATEQQAVATQPPAEVQPPAQTEAPVVQPGQPTAASGGPTAIATVNTNCRSGPGKKYPKVSNLGVDLRASIQGKDATGTWWYIQNNKKAGGFCWISTDTVKVEGDTSSLPIVEAMSLEAAQTQAAQTGIPQAPVAPVATVNPTATP